MNFFVKLGFGVLKLIFDPSEVILKLEFLSIKPDNFLLKFSDLGIFIVVSLCLHGFMKEFVSFVKMFLKKLDHIFDEHRNFFFESGLK